MQLFNLILAALPALALAQDADLTMTQTSTTTVTKTLTLSRVHALFQGNSTATQPPILAGSVSHANATATPAANHVSNPNAGAALDASKIAMAGVAGMVVMVMM